MNGGITAKFVLLVGEVEGNGWPSLGDVEIAHAAVLNPALQFVENDTPASTEKRRKNAASSEELAIYCGIGGCTGLFRYNIFCPGAERPGRSDCLLN